MRKLMMLLLPLVILGCSDDENPQPIEEFSPLIKSKTWGPNDFVQFKYNPQGKLIRYFSQWTTVIGTDITTDLLYEFIYQNDKLSAAKMSQKGTPLYDYLYVYQQNKLATIEQRNQQNQLLRKFTITYLENKLSEIIVENYDQFSNLVAREKIHFTFANDGNISDKKDYIWDENQMIFKLVYQEHYKEYDNMLRIEPYFYQDVFIPGIQIYKNNPLEVEVRINGNLDKVYLHQYEYNEQQYPVLHKQRYKDLPSIPQLVATWNYY